jgi:hypothetical protein
MRGWRGHEFHMYYSFLGINPIVVLKCNNIVVGHVPLIKEVFLYVILLCAMKLLFLPINITLSFSYNYF